MDINNDNNKIVIEFNGFREIIPNIHGTSTWYIHIITTETTLCCWIKLLLTETFHVSWIMNYELWINRIVWVTFYSNFLKKIISKKKDTKKLTLKSERISMTIAWLLLEGFPCAHLWRWFSLDHSDYIAFQLNRLTTCH